MTATAFEDLKADFEFIDDWEERYKYVIELGKEMPALDSAEHNEANKVNGCVSQVWLKSKISTDDKGRKIFTFTGDSDAMIVRGLVAILRILLNGRTVEEVAAMDIPAQLESLGLNENLTSQRANGLASMVNRIKAEATAAI